MAKKPETLFKEKIKPRIESLPFSWWLKTQMLALLGIPDYIGCIDGRFVAMELKRSEKQMPTKLQQYVLNKINEAGGLGIRCNPQNFEEVFLSLKGLAYRRMGWDLVKERLKLYTR